MLIPKVVLLRKDSPRGPKLTTDLMSISKAFAQMKYNRKGTKTARKENEDQRDTKIIWTTKAINFVRRMEGLSHTTDLLMQFGTQVKFRWSRDCYNRTADPRPGIFLRWNSNLQLVDFAQGFA